MAKAGYTVNVVVIGPVVTTDAHVEAAFNEWMRLTIEEPEQFLQQWQAINGFQSDEAHGKAPSYGRGCTEFLIGLLKQRDEHRAIVKGAKPARARAKVKRSVKRGRP